MRSTRRIACFLMMPLLVLLAGCNGGGLVSSGEPIKMLELQKQSLPQPPAEAFRTLAGSYDFDKTLSEYFEVANREAVPVEGFAIVEGLAGTGDAATPDIRQTLSAQATSDITKAMHDLRNKTADYLVERSTALVRISGIIPRFSRQNDLVDVVVTPLMGNDVRSLEGGYIRSGRMRSYKTVRDEEGTKLLYSVDQVSVEGPLSLQPPGVYDPKAVSRPKVAFIPGGGLLFYPFVPHLRTRDYPDIKEVLSRSSGVTRRINRLKRLILISERTLVNRFGSEAARVVDYNRAEVLPVKVPKRYDHWWEHYFDVMMAVKPTDLVDQGRDDIEPSMRQLGSNDLLTRQNAWFRLEAIGEPAVPAALEGLQSSDPNVKFYSALVLSSLGNTAGLPVLREFADRSVEDASEDEAGEMMRKRILAARMMPSVGKEGVPLLRGMLNDPYAAVRYYALVNLEYMNHRLPQSVHVSRPTADPRGRTLFYLDHVKVGTGPSLMVVKLQDPRRIIVFGPDPVLQAGIEVKQGRYTLTTREDSTAYIQVGSRQPERLGRGTVLNIIPYMHLTGVTYNDIAALVKQLVDRKLISADVAWIDTRN